MLNTEPTPQENPTCWVCDSAYKKLKKIDWGKTYLDGIPKKNTMEYFDSLFEMCPECGFVSKDLTRIGTSKTNFDVLFAMHEDGYKKILNDNTLHNDERKLLLRKYISDNEIEFSDDINELLFSYYDIRGEWEKAKEYASKEIKRLEDIAKMKNEFYEEKRMQLSSCMGVYMKLMEYYRRFGMFEKVMEIFRLYKGYKYNYFQKEDKKYIKKEYQLAKEGIKERI